MASEVLGAFEHAGIDSILLKGSTLAHLYRERHRSYSDVDLLVPPHAIEPAGEALRRLGFADASEGMRPEELSPHATTWDRPGGGASVDLHHSLWGTSVEPGRVWSVLAHHVVGHQLAGRRVSALDPAGQALHLVLHAVQSRTGSRRTLEELERGLVAIPQSAWSEAAAIADDLGATAAFHLGIQLTPVGRDYSIALGSPAHQLPRSLVVAALTSAPATALSTLGAQEGVLRKLRWAARRTFPSVALIRATEPLARRHATLVPLGYLLRPFRLAWRCIPAMIELRGVPRDDRAPEKPV